MDFSRMRSLSPQPQGRPDALGHGTSSFFRSLNDSFIRIQDQNFRKKMADDSNTARTKLYQQKKSDSQKDTKLQEAKFLATEAQRAETTLQTYKSKYLQLMGGGLPMSKEKMEQMASGLEQGFLKDHPYEADLINNREKYMRDLFKKFPMTQGAIPDEPEDNAFMTAPASNHFNPNLIPQDE